VSSPTQQLHHAVFFKLLINILAFKHSTGSLQCVLHIAAGVHLQQSKGQVSSAAVAVNSLINSGAFV
jgi:hypothetical protein